MDKTLSNLDGCGNDFLARIYEEFPVSVYGKYCSQDLIAIADTHNGMIDVICGAGRSAVAPGTGATNPSVATEAYPDRLVYLGGLDDVFSSTSEMWVEGVEVHVYDPKDFDDTEVQDEDVNAALLASISTPGMTLPQSPYRFGMMPQFQPNWLNPKLTICGRSYLASAGKTNHKAHNSIGLPHPVCRAIYNRIAPPIQESNIVFSAQAGSWIPQLEKMRRLFVVGILWFRLKQ